jgi:hypothetical protein
MNAHTLITESARDHAARNEPAYKHPAPSFVLAPAYQVRDRLERAKAEAEDHLAELNRALAKPDDAILFHAQAFADVLTWPASRALDFTREAITKANAVPSDEALRMMMDGSAAK